MQATQYLFHGNPDRAFAINLVEPSIKFFALSIRDRDCHRRRRKTVPELLKELKLLFSAKRCDVDHYVVPETKK